MTIPFGRRTIGSDQPVFIIAELSANHGQNFEQAVRIVEAAHEAGADAVKLQTYTADTLTIDSDREYFRIGEGTSWEGRNLYDLYREAYTPWEWQPKLKDAAESLGMELFSTPFDATAVDFLEAMNVPAHKVASFEVVDLPLLRRIGRTGKPVIMSTGMSSEVEIAEAVAALRGAGCHDLVLLKCTSAYPASPSSMNLRTLTDMAARFETPVGLSDHTLDIAVPVTAVALGACVIEKHLTLSRTDGGPDSGFSLEPHEFRAMVEAVRTAEEALGEARYGGAQQEDACRKFRRSLFIVHDVELGETLTEQHVRSIRPGDGLAPKHLDEILGRRASERLTRGTPLQWRHIA
jgi:N-acetylneuraminate synthase